MALCLAQRILDMLDQDDGITEIRKLCKSLIPERDWRVGLRVKKDRERGTVEAVFPNGTAGLLCDQGIFFVRLDGGSARYVRSREWAPES